MIPTIQHGQQVFGTVEGTALALPCRASGLPPPEITWAKVSPPQALFICFTVRTLHGAEEFHLVSCFVVEKLYQRETHACERMNIIIILLNFNTITIIMFITTVVRLKDVKPVFSER